MAEPVPVPLGLTSSQGRTPAEGGAILINCYADNAGSQAKYPNPIYAVDGFDLFSEITGDDVGAIRGGFALTPSALYVVTGERVANINASGTATLLDGNVAASGFVTMARNRKEPDAQIAIGISSDEGALYFVESDTLTAYDLDALGSNGTLVGLTAIDGYFVILMSNGEFFITAIDAGTIDELDFAKAEANPDGGIAIAVLGSYVVIFGEKSMEFWSNTGSTDFPFERSQSRSYGCYAAGTLKNAVQTREGSGVSDTLVFATTDSEGAYIGICIMQGTEPVKISTPALDREIKKTAPHLLRSQVWSNGERTFYCVSGPTFSFVYDFATGFWHQRKSNGLEFWRIATANTFGTTTIVGDYESASLYEMKTDLFNDTDPCMLTLRHSNDGGQSWITRTSRQISGASNQTQRVRINRIGRSKYIGKAYEISITQAVMENDVGLTMSIQTPTVHAWPSKAQMAAAHIDIVPGVSLTSRPKGILGLALQADSLTEQAH